MKIAAKLPKPVVDLNKARILTFLQTALKDQDISFEQVRARLNISISDKALHRIVIDAEYGVIK